ncbi:hypothetical protein BJ138DRAFT_862448 [Hygrophoropsis aurantiaca]|uniref:Uncharacterized protein n=1 Tax=Hygrophoropsis aurantiaca TaxID=72124 RepID=A0ACB8AGM6_9AGAM|nr:hypothetical protein BJ138DRAFT_862448 [Hygrophoropsis aurantiaca]
MTAGTIASNISYRNNSRAKFASKIRVGKDVNASQRLLFLRPPSLSLKHWFRRVKRSASSVIGMLTSSSSSVTLAGSDNGKKFKVVRFVDTLEYIEEPKPKELDITCNNNSDDDDESIYEDCVSHYPGFETDYWNFLDKVFRRCKTRHEIYRARRLHGFRSPPAFSKQEEYSTRCFAKYLEAQKEKERQPQKLVFAHPATLRWPSRVAWEAARDNYRPPPPPPPFVLPAHPWDTLPCVPQSWFARLKDRIEGEIIICSFGLVIHMCLFMYFIYHVIFHIILRCSD